MKRSIFRVLAKINDSVLPKYSKKDLDLANTSKFQKAIIGWKYFVTKNSLPN